MNHSRTSFLVAGMTLSAISLALTGCASRAPLAAWQDALSAYIAEEGHGDPMVIRNLPDLRSPHRARPGQIVFGEIDAGNRDVQGVFVGHRPSAGATWFFFVVGVMQHKTDGYTQLEDLRLVALTPQGKQLGWRLSQRDPRLPEMYATSRTTSGLLHRGQVRGAAFPHVQDYYELTVTGQYARVHERRSGTSWELNLAATHHGAALAAAHDGAGR